MMKMNLKMMVVGLVFGVMIMTSEVTAGVTVDSIPVPPGAYITNKIVGVVTLCDFDLDSYNDLWVILQNVETAGVPLGIDPSHYGIYSTKLKKYLWEGFGGRSSMVKYSTIDDATPHVFSRGYVITPDGLILTCDGSTPALEKKNSPLSP